MSTTSLHQRIRGDIEDRIRSGEWPPGHRVPFETELMAQYDCARMTVSKAMAALVEAGLIVRRKRAGSFVARPRVHAPVLNIPDIQSAILARGETYAFRCCPARCGRPVATPPTRSNWRRAASCCAGRHSRRRRPTLRPGASPDQPEDRAGRRDRRPVGDPAGRLAAGTRRLDRGREPDQRRQRRRRCRRSARSGRRRGLPGRRPPHLARRRPRHPRAAGVSRRGL
jgi:hypothetical protein